MNKIVKEIINQLYYIRKECHSVSYILLNNINETNNKYKYILNYGIELKKEEKYLILMLLYNK